ncbi:MULTISPECIES: ABC transporter ATP-binding protein [Sanguibacteroides]|uniref:Antibiotic ABC transporter ATP-binding protein n=1 Tax=Sanguibacteroides justesenii TaxID=1547597 RepID=A0A0C3RIK0_9PORP|nr:MULTISPECIES: ABC transporter ATP-binding protein [Sanguibacteroides]KIO43645.1 antibiotic ABC transporter ATP-binding protein [Sanguibacteroides justesenii]KIO45809.1 antibiotic ABC transporter ATP-binding protein [Sanguibacteroides justesenii]PXZ45105.1 ABC transporter ATP-binding protein [Sanguibacteroides justesenii]
MHDLLTIFKRFIPPYKLKLTKSILFNFLHALFGSLAIAMLMPVLGIIFDNQKDVHELVPYALTKEAVSNNFYYYITQIKHAFGPSTTLIFVGLLAVIATALKTGFAYLAAYELIYIRNGVVRDIRRKIYSKILSLPLPFFSEERKGDIISRMTGDVQEVEASVMSSLDMLFQSPILIIVYLTTMLIMSWQLTLFVFVLLPIMGGLIGKIGKNLKRHSWEGQNKMGEILSLMEETLSGLRIIKAFSAEKKMKSKFSEENESYRRIQNRLMRRRSLAHPVSEFLGTIVIVIVLWFGGSLVLEHRGALDAEAFIAYIALFYSIINPAKNLTNAYYSVQKGLAAMDRIDMILDTQPSIQEPAEPQRLEEFQTSIEYKQVRFSYNDSKQVLKNINVCIPKGKTVALVGQSGSGKSTFVDLLPRFYDVNNGAITIDGIDIRNLTFHNLRELMGNVNQDPILFNDTIYNNIAFGVEQATREEIENAARIANAHDFILQTEQGYQTVIGDRGCKLSGGQRQRLSIARAVLKNPPIMILDEATSALDTESEKLVQDALDNLMKNRTSIVIAHRLSTIRNADLICVFHEGEIVERGRHEELLALNGVYAKLYNMQNF